MNKFEVRWAPSKHRSLHGDQEDHGLLVSFWTWRIRSVKVKPVKDFSVLKDPVVTETFDQAVEPKLCELGCTLDTDPDTTTLHGYLNAVILG